MDPGSDQELAVSRYVSLLETPQAYEIHALGRATIETYPLTDEGFDAAWDRYADLTRAGRTGRFLSALAIIAVVAAALWLVVVLVTSALYVALIHSRSSDPLGGLVGWLSPFTTVFYALFASAVGTYAVVWIARGGMPSATKRR